MVPECRHIKTSGGKCGSPALRGQPYCYFHSRLKERTAQSNFFRTTPLSKELSNLEDRGAIQHAITHVAMAIADRHINTREAGLILYALQIASGNAKNSEQIVASDAIEELTLTEQGEEMAPEGATSHPQEEESLADMLMREVRRHREEYQQLNPDQSAEPAENKELTRKSQGEGGTPADDPEFPDEFLDEFGHPKPQF
jgi:hypothetical protein